MTESSSSRAHDLGLRGDQAFRGGADEAINRLRQARQFAQSANRDPWQFAIELTCLQAIGVSKTELRWMICQGIVDHAYEVTLRGADERSFAPSGSLRLDVDSCFVICESEKHDALGFDFADPGNRAKVTPQWLADSRELKFEDKVVKQFRRPAPNQETVLSSFQEEDWSVRIDDPLPPRDGQDSKRRLHDTINALNRNQKHQSIRFYGDGTGEGICWEARPESVA